MIGNTQEASRLDNQPSPNPRETVIFLHTPKTGGTTIDRLLERIYPRADTFETDSHLHRRSIEEFRGLPAGERDSFRLIMGHMAFGVHEYIRNPCSYFTYFREPVDRTISAYYYVRETRNHPHHARLIESGYSMRETFERGAFTALGPNQCVKWLSGYHEEPFVANRDTLELAKRNLVDHFSVVGLTELFDESLVLIAARYGWRNVWYNVTNVTRHRLKAEQIDPATIDVIRAYNELDIELYEFAKQRLRDQLHAYGPSLDLKVKELRARNWVHRKINSARWRARRVTDFYHRLSRSKVSSPTRDV